MTTTLARRFLKWLGSLRTLRHKKADSSICQHEGCDNVEPAIPCFLSDDPPDQPSYHYCSKHAPDEGFCWGCGGFWAGIESFDFGGSGLCENCEGDCHDDDENWDLAVDDEDDF